MTEKQLKFINKTLKFFERKSIFTVIIILTIFLVTVMVSHYIFGMNALSNFFINSFGEHILDNNSNLTTIATVFIGIYFSVYTLLMSSNKNSAYDELSSKNKLTLVKIVSWGFFSSFGYVFFTLLYTYLFRAFPLFFSLFLFMLLVVFLYSAFVFSIVMFILMKQDIMKNIK